MHVPVLLEEVMDLLGVKSGGKYLDCTFGGGGHTRCILERSGPDGRVLALDADPEAVERGGELAGRFPGRLEVVNANFEVLEEVAGKQGFREADGVLMDLGVSSFQLDSAHRGFSFMAEGPLDMRLNAHAGLPASEWLKRVDEAELVGVLRTYGDEPDARRISRAVVAEARQDRLETTSALANLVERVKGGRRGKIHPATKTFMALRIAVNRELEVLQTGLEQAFRIVRPGGRIAVIAFHSGEDRIVKRTLSSHVGLMESLPEGGQRWVGTLPSAVWVRRKPLKANEKETGENPRARSALLRVVERAA